MNPADWQILIATFTVWFVLTFPFGFCVKKISDYFDPPMHSEGGFWINWMVGVLAEVFLFIIYWVGYFIVWSFRVMWHVYSVST